MGIENNLDLKELYKIDKNIDALVKQIELLSYVNPLNIERQKKIFFEVNYNYEPKFTYPKIDFDKFLLHRKLFTQPIENIKNKRLKQIYEDIIYFYSGLIQCIETIGEGKKFYYNSLHSFGTPTEKDIANAKFILEFREEDNLELFKPKYSPKQAEKQFKEYSKRYNFNYKISYSSKMSAIAMVLNNKQKLVLNSNHKYSDNEMGILTNHEIGVHMVTTMNGLLQPLKIFSHGLPNNVETQEGLSVYSEYMSGNLTMKRLKRLSYRVIAVDSLAKGYSFSQTFKMLLNKYHIAKEDAFYITLRVHRGGGFTKDYLYLTGFIKILQYVNAGKDVRLLLTGKVSLEYVNDIAHLINKKYATLPSYITDSFSENKNKNTKITFILDNLK